MWVMRMSPRGQQGGAGVVYVECNFFSLGGINPYGQPDCKKAILILTTSLTLHHYHLTHETVLPLVSHPWKDIVSHKVEKVEPHLF